MFFPTGISESIIMEWCEKQIPATMSASKHGIDIEIRTHKKIRSVPQNSYLMKICQHIMKFYDETGFLIYDMKKRELYPEGIKVFWKERLGIEKTRKLSTKEFGEFVDKIQREMVEESGGEYEMLIPPDYYGESLTKGNYYD